MKTYNINPYFDDFSEDNGFHQIMFKPGYAVQARELTQLQTILRDQIRKFGNHIFKHGSVVIPGNSFADLATPYVKMVATYNSNAINPASFEGKTVIGATSGIKAVVKKAVAATTTDPVTFYVSYITGGGSGGSTNVFLASEEVYDVDNSTLRATVQASTPVGTGSLAFINDGVFYIRGSFVYVNGQSVVLQKYGNAPSCHVLLQINESVVTPEQDGTLLDPAQGSYNYAAPGADRVKMELVLTTLDLGSTIDDNYVELMRYNTGVLEEHARYAQYSELEKSLARRTYDESGNYLVSGFGYQIRDHLKTKYNDGVSTTGDRSKFAIEVQPGKGYIDGLEVETLNKRTIIVDKARTADHTKARTETIKTTYGRHIYVSDLKSLPNFNTRQVVDLYNDNDPTNGSATKIGDVRVVAIDYLVGDQSAGDEVYKLYIDELNLNAGYEFGDVGGLRFDASGSAVVLTKYNVPSASYDFVEGSTVSNRASTRTATVRRYLRSTGELYVSRHDTTKQIPTIGEYIVGSSANSPAGTISSVESVVGAGNVPIFGIPAIAVKTLKNIDTNTYDISYTAWKRVSISTNSSGYGTYTATDGTIVSPEVGTVVAVGPSGVVTNDKLSLSGTNTIVITGGPTSSTVNMLIQVEKQNVQPKVKTLTTTTLTGVAPATTISLGKADVYRVVSIFAGSTEVTDAYTLNDGQTDYYYGLGSLELTGTLPTTNLSITFEYFEHTGSGDFFCVDSYSTLGDDYITKASKYRSKSTGEFFNLAKAVDFRPRVGTTGSFTSNGPSLIDVPVIDTFTVTSVQYYVPRIDVVYLHKNKTVGVARGIPKDVPLRPTSPEGSVEIAVVFVPAYTMSIADVLTRSLKNYRYTMSDIKKIDNRVTNVEYFSTLNSLETSLLSYDIVDPETGLNRFKNGYLVDNFENVFTVCDFYNSDNRSSFFKRNLSTAVEDHEATVQLLSNSTNYQLTGDLVTLPYDEVAFITQGTSTRVTNLNPFMVFSWEGVMTVQPAFDTWIETQDLPTIYKTVEETVRIRSQVVRPAPPPPPVVADPAPEPAWEPPVAVVTPVRQPEPTAVITALARDLGLVDPSAEGSDLWDEIVAFTVPQSVFDQTMALLDPSLRDPAFFQGNNEWTRSEAWTTAIEATNRAFDSALSATSAVGGFNTLSGTAPSTVMQDRFTTDQIINFWQERS